MRTLMMHFDGLDWRAYLGPSVGFHQVDLNAVTAAADGTFWATGTVQDLTMQPLLEHLIGGQWRRVAIRMPGRFGQLNGITALPNGTVWAVGSDSRMGRTVSGENLLSVRITGSNPEVVPIRSGCRYRKPIRGCACTRK
jgi:hypothetical protein